MKPPLKVCCKTRKVHWKWFSMTSEAANRLTRLLMAYVYLCRGEPSPITSTEGKPTYIQALRRADRGNLKAFSDHIGALAYQQLQSIVETSKETLAGYKHVYHANGGVTNKGVYYPPDPDPSDEWEIGD